MAARERGGRREYDADPPPLVPYLRDILTRYPDGGQILKELLQNANDAGADQVKFLLNSSQYPTESLIHGNMADLQGAALYEYNNGVFSDNDWKGIRRPGRSVKKKDVMKVGRFGIGFNSVYHMTDVPSVMSGTCVAFFDPMLCHHTGQDIQQADTPEETVSGDETQSSDDDVSSDDDDSGDATRRNDGKVVAHFELSHFSADFPDQSATFNVLGHDVAPNQEAFEGTLFRFPLRQRHPPDRDAQGEKVMSLSQTIYKENDVEEKLFQPFCKEADILLLFVTNVQCVELYKQRERENAMCRQLLQISRTSRQVHPDRSDIGRQLRDAIEAKDCVVIAAPIDITVTGPDGTSNASMQSWSVLHSLGTKDKSMKKVARDLRLHPWVGMAIPIGSNDSTVVEWLFPQQQVHGQAFCFLPLPIETGLPVHIHGYFAVTSDRRFLKWPKDDNKDKDAKWNKKLVEVCLRDLYVYALKQLASCRFLAMPNDLPQPDTSTKTCRAYSIWPDITHVPKGTPWQALTECLLPALYDEKLLWSWSRGGRWLSVEEAWIMQASSEEAVAADRVDITSSDGLHVFTSTAMQHIYSFLLEIDEPVVLLPPSVLATLRSTTAIELEVILQQRTVAPCNMRDIIRRLQNSGRSCLPYFKESRVLARDLLYFVISDLAATTTLLDVINDLEMLPTLGSPKFCSLSSNDVLFCCSGIAQDTACAILPGLESSIINTAEDAMDDGTRKTLTAIAQPCATRSKLCSLSDEDVPELLRHSVSTWSSEFGQTACTYIAWNPESSTCGEEWLKSVWEWYSHCSTVPLEFLEGLPLLPVCSVQTHTATLFCLHKFPTVLLADGLRPSLQVVLERLGSSVIPKQPDYLQRVCLDKYTCRATPAGLLCVLYNIKEHISLAELNNSLSKASPGDVRELRHAISAGDVDNSDFSQQHHLNLLQSLKLWHCHATNEIVSLDQRQFKALPRFLPREILSLNIRATLLSPCYDESEERLLQHLGVPLVTVDSLLLDYLLPLHCEEIQLPVLSFICDQQHRLEKATMEKLKSVKFVPSSKSHKLHVPTDLLDPEDPVCEVSNNLFSREDHDLYFPVPKELICESWLSALCELGLKQPSNMPKDDVMSMVIDRTKSVATMIGLEDRTAAVARSGALLRFVLSYKSRVPDDWFHRLTSSLTCFLAKGRPSQENYPPAMAWMASDASHLYTGNEIHVPGENGHLLLGSTAHLLDDKLAKIVGSDLLLFGLKQVSTSVKEVALHLRNMSQSLGQQTDLLSKHDLMFLEKSTQAIYELLHSRFRQDSDIIVPILRDVACVWLPDRRMFVPPRKLVVNLPDDIACLAPYRYVVKGHLLQVFPLFENKVFGGNQNLQGHHLVSVLQEINDDITGGTLSEEQRKLVLSIVGCTATQNACHEQSVLLPTALGCLVDAEETSYCDCKFLQNSSEVPEDTYAKFNVVDAKVPHEIAKQYGAKPLSIRLLAAKPLKYETHNAGVPITDTIKECMKDLPEGVPLLRELIQNAEDAGASKVKFLLDYRNLKGRSRRLLSDRMSHWQGPALWVYNDAVFSDEDNRNMLQLHGNFKKEQPGFVGQSGIGFCSVYHLTDVPSVISGRHITILDPQGTNIPGRTGEFVHGFVHGIQLNFVEQQEGMRVFADQFSPYKDVFDCQILGDSELQAVSEYRGTLFRFPLRDGPLGMGMSVCKPLADNAIEKALQVLHSQAAEYLVFSQHIESIEVFQLDKGAMSAAQCNRVSSARVSKAQCVSGDHHAKKLFYDIAQELRSSSVVVPADSHTVYTVDITSTENSAKSSQKWLVAGSFSGSQLGANNVGAASKLWASTAVKLSGGMERSDGMAYCNLPLPIKTGLPVHISAFFTMCDNRHYWDNSSFEQIAGGVLQHSVSSAYVLMLNGLKEQLLTECTPPSLTALQVSEILPGACKPRDSWQCLSNLVLDEVISSQAAVVWTEAGGGRWITLSSAIILGQDLALGPLSTVATRVLLTLDENIVADCVSENHPLYRAMLSAGKQSVFLQTRPFVTEKLMKNLENLPEELADEGVKEFIRFASGHSDGVWCSKLLSTTRCIRSQDGQLRCPGELMYHRHQCLQELFADDKHYLPDEKLAPVLDMLPENSKLLSHPKEEWLLDKVVQLTNTAEQYIDRHLIMKKIEYLWQAIDGKWKTLSGEALQKLHSCPLVPVLQKPMDWCLKWKVEDQFFAPAAQVLPYMYWQSVGSIALIADPDITKKFPELCEKLGLARNAQPSADQLLEQMSVLVAAADDVHSSTSSGSASKKAKILDRVTSCITEIYKLLLRCNDLSRIMNSRCVWSRQHGMFLEPTISALRAPENFGNLMPFRLTVDESLSEDYREVFMALGVKETLTTDDLKDILCQLQQSCAEDTSGSLSQSKIELAVRLIKVLHFNNDVTKSTLLPTEGGKMMEAVECTYFDRMELLSALDSEEDIKATTVHHELASIAQHLKAKPLSERLLKSDPLGLDYEEVGQHEPLTTRLKNILGEYPGDETVLKELIQNADDAGATSVRFVMDWRDLRNTKKPLLDEEMRKWQGPALLAFNDAQFSPEDFDNIMKLGGATKKDDEAKIGRFGLGFSSVYHLTDVPSFVSGNYIIFLDPHTTNLGSRVSDKRPGMKINFVQSASGLQKFSEQFELYQGVFGCQLEEQYHGTLFRFPLRSCDTESQISDFTPAGRDIMDVFKTFWTQLPSVLLFLQSVRSVELYEIQQGSRDVRFLCGATASDNGADDVEKSVRKGLQVLRQKGGLSEVSSDSESKCHVTQVTINTTIDNAGKEQLRVKSSASSSSQTWIISAGLGISKSRELAMSQNEDIMGLVPWGGCAVPVQLVNGRLIGSQTDGKVFSFLPLPIDTHLPFHLNGCFSITSSRRSLEHTADGNVKTHWNEEVLSDAVPRTYLSLIEALAKTCSTSDGREQLGKLLPEPECQTSSFSFRPTVINSIYTHLLSGSQFRVLWRLMDEQWVTGKESLYLMDVDDFGQYYHFATGFLANHRKPVVELPEAARVALKMFSATDGETFRTNMLSFQEFFQTVFVSSLSEHDNMELSLKLLQCLLNYCNVKEEKWCFELLKKERIIPTTQGSLKKASDLVDSTVSELSVLYCAEDDYFPSTALMDNHNWRYVLRKVGLHHQQLPPHYVLERAMSVSSLQGQSQESAVERTVAILQYISPRTGELSSIQEDLIQCAFLPVSQGTKDYLFECVGKGQMRMRAASELFPEQDIHILGSRRLILDEANLKELSGEQCAINTRVMKFLGIEGKSIPVEPVLKQFRCVVDKLNSDSSSFQEEHMTKTIHSLYRYFSTRNIDAGRKKLPMDTVWIPSHKRFMPRSKVVRHESGQWCEWYRILEPYCFVLDKSLVEFNKFFSQLEIMKDLSDEFLVSILQKMRTDIGDGCLSKSQQTICNTMLPELAERLSSVYDSVNSILLPTVDDKLKAAGECSYVDCDFLALDGADSSSLNIVKLDTMVAKKLGANPVSRRLLNSKKVEFRFEKSGQKEPLTTRLQNNLREYPKGVTVLKELIQNADDAGASTVNFVLDHRHHPCGTVFAKSMEKWQGPALLCFNDKPFLEDDFDNIMLLGGATKQKKLDKIGKFGLGFSSVYNLTDVPSFISRNKLVIFDPHIDNLTTTFIDAANPGMTVDFVNENGVQKFRDQLLPYHNMFGCKTVQEGSSKPEPFQSTLFRFPLRTDGTSSRICTHTYDIKSIQKMLQELYSNAEEYLLFLQCVKKISVYEMSDSCDTTELSRPVFCCKVTETESMSPEQLSGHQRDSMRKWVREYWREKDGCKVMAQRRLTIVVEDCSHSQQVPCSDSTSRTWIVCEGTGHGKAVDFASKPENSKEAAVPWGSVAMKVDPLSGDPQLRGDGRVFCFLPLPMQHPYPLHINGFFAIASNRRSVVDSTDSNFGTQWNKCLLEDPVAVAYLQMLHCWTRFVASKGQPSLSLAEDLWKLIPSPEKRPEHGVWQVLPGAFHDLLLAEDAPSIFWLPVGNGDGKWFNASALYWLDCPEFDHDLELMDMAVQTLHQFDVPALPLPTQYAAPELKCKFRLMNYEDFFEKYFFPHSGDMPQKVQAKLLKHLLQLQCSLPRSTEWINTALGSAACIRSSTGEMVQCQYLIDRTATALSILFSEDDGRFANRIYDFSLQEVLVLRTAGMIYHQLPNPEILDRAKSIKTLDVEHGKERAHLLLTLLANDDYQKQISSDDSTEEELQKVPFLPKAEKPDNYPLQWFSSTVEGVFVSAVDSLSIEHKFLAGSVATIVDLKHYHSVGKMLLSRPPMLKAVLEQLDKLLCHYDHLQSKPNERNILEPMSACNDLDANFIKRATGVIYCYLSKAISNCDDKAEVEFAKSTIVEYLRAKTWIWFHNCFVDPESVVICGAKNAHELSHAPLFNVVRPEHILYDFRPLWKAIGLTDQFSSQYIRKVTTALYSAYSIIREPAVKDHRTLLIKAANVLVDKGIDQLSDDERESIVLSAHDSQLHFIKQLSFNDTDWLTVEEISSGSCPIILASPDIPRSLADSLKLSRASHRMVKSVGFGEDFGQNEVLTDRIASILDKYPPDVSILKELIQNADDAQATSMHFVLDCRTDLPDRRLLNPNVAKGRDPWKELQHCPALCIFNDRPFSDKDITGITQLGRGSKRDDPKSTGRFGIGFNAVYHITDCPSFLSRGRDGRAENLCFFDPLCEFEPGATSQHSGRRYCNTNPGMPDLENTFPDQFTGYLARELPDVGNAMEGSTVFRLPLRGEYQYRKDGRIKGTSSWSIDCVKNDLICALQQSGPQLLLFLKNVTSIKASVLEANGGLKEFFHVSRTVSGGQEAISMSRATAAGGNQQFCHYTQETVLETPGNPVESEDWLMVQCNEPDKKQICHIGPHKSMVEAVEAGRNHGLYPKGGVAAKLSMPKDQAMSSRSFQYRPHGQLLKKKSMVEAVQIGSDHGLYPTGGVAAKLSRPKDQADSGQMFTTLPTPIRTGMPVHINGHFLLDDSRKHLEDVSTGATNIRSWWNDWLLEYVVLPAYRQLLLEAQRFVKYCVQPYDSDAGKTAGDAKENARGVHTVRISSKHRGNTKISASLEWYYSLFPRNGRLAKEIRPNKWQKLCCSLYSQICVEKSRVLASHHADSNMWEPWLPCIGKEAGVFHDQLQKSKDELFYLLINISIPLTQAPSCFLYEIDQRAGDGQQYEKGKMATPEYVREYLRSKGRDFIHEQMLGAAEANAANVALLIHYCLHPLIAPLSAKEENFVKKSDESIEGLPLRLTADGRLNIFSQKCSEYTTYNPCLVEDRPSIIIMMEVLHNSKELQALLDTGKSSCVRPLPLSEVATSARVLHSDLLQPAVPMTDSSIQRWLKGLWKYIVRGGVTWDKLCTDLKGISFIPAKSNGDVVLQPVRNAGLIIRCDERSENHLRTALKKLGMFVPAFEYAFKDHGEVDTADTYRHVVQPGFTDVDEHKKLLKELARLKASDCSELTMLEAETVLQHLITNGALSSEERNMVKCLPIYPSVDNTRVSLRCATSFFKMEEQMPSVGCEVWCRNLDHSIQVLSEIGPRVVDFLVKILGIHRLSGGDIYVQVIVPFLMEMVEGHRIEHLRYIRDHLLQVLPADKKEKKQLLSCVSGTPFVIASNGQRRKARELFCHCPEFDRFVKKEFFPNEFWHGHEWKQFLQSLGYTATVTMEVFPQLARAIERAWFGSRCALQPCFMTISQKDSRAASELLIPRLNHLTTTAQKYFSTETNTPEEGKRLQHRIDKASTFLKEIRGIQFLFPYVAQDLLSVLLAGRTQHLYSVPTFQPAALQNMVTWQWHDVVWTTQAVCQKEVDLDNAPKVQEYLGMRSRPQVQTVLSHVLALVKALISTECKLDCMAHEYTKDRIWLKQCFTNIYEFLNHECKDSRLTMDCIQNSLQRVPCILVDDGKSLLPPAQVTCEQLTGISYLPHLAQLESGFQNFTELMHNCLGIAKVTTLHQYALVLRLLHGSNVESHPSFNLTADANQMEMIRSCFLSLVTLLESPALEDHAAAKAASRRDVDLDPLYLPSCSAHQIAEKNVYSPLQLIPAKELVVMDAKRFFRRLKHYDGFRYLAPLYEPHMLLEPVAKALQVRMLSEIVKEKFDQKRHSAMNYMWDSSAEDDEVEDGVHPKVMQTITLLQSHEFGEGVQRILNHGQKDSTMAHICDSGLRQLREARFVVVRQLQTVLEQGNRLIPGSEEDQFCCYEWKPRLTVSLRNPNNTSASLPTDYLIALTRKTIQILRGTNTVSRSELELLLILEGGPDNVQDVLDKVELDPYTSDEVSGGGYGLPQLGSPVPLDVFDVASNPHEQHFPPNELVVHFLEQEEDYILVKVVTEITSTSAAPLERKFLVQVDNDGTIKEVFVTSLFQFNSMKRGIGYQLKDNGQVAKYTGEVDQTPRDTSETDLAGAKKKICQELGDIMKITDEESRKTAFRRMQFRWHPDKHGGQEDLYTVAFQYLMNLYEHLQKGGTLENFERDSPAHTRENSYWADNFRSTYHGTRHWSSHSHSHSSHEHSHSYGSSSRSRHSSHRGGGFFSWASTGSSSTKHGVQSDYDGERFVKQAMADLSILQHHVCQGEKKHYAQACFMGQQVVEKALKGGLLHSRHGLTSDQKKSHDVLLLAMHLSGEAGCSELPSIAKVVAKYYLPTRYPDASFCYVRKCPYEAYSLDEAKEALVAAERVLELIKVFTAYQP